MELRMNVVKYPFEFVLSNGKDTVAVKVEAESYHAALLKLPEHSPDVCKKGVWVVKEVNGLDIKEFKKGFLKKRKKIKGGQPS